MKAWIIWIARVLWAGSLPKKEVLIDIALEVKKLIIFLAIGNMVNWYKGK